MIVSCPSCGARYRVEATRESDRGRCSGCGSEVPIVSAPRSYILREATAGGAPWKTPAARVPQAHTPPTAAYDPWKEPATEAEQELAAPPRDPQPSGSTGSPLLPALLAVVGALLGYWAGANGFVGELPVVSAAGPAGLAALGASLGLLAGWAGDRWIAGR